MNNNSFLLTVIFILNISIAYTQNETIYVDKDVIGGLHNGMDWGNAYASLEHALVVADSGNVLWVAEGEYKINELSGRAASFVIRDGISVYGGFQGNETLFIDRNPDLYPTILSGDIGELGDSTDNSYHIIRIQNVKTVAVVDGVQIKNGNALGGEEMFPFSRAAGAILVFSALSGIDTAEIYINNCKIYDNAAFFGGALAFHKDYAVPTTLNISATVFENNISYFYGGSIYIPDFSPIPLSVKINDTQFLNNISERGGGGAIYDYHILSEWDIDNGYFFENKIPHGLGGAFGGEYTGGIKNINIINSHFERNKCSSNGGAIGIVHLGGEISVNFSLKRTSFIENESFANAGAAISIGSQDLLELVFSVDYCDFIKNKAISDGANIFIKTANGSDGKIDINHCTFKENASWSPAGGALWIRVSASTNNFIPRSYEISIRNSLFANNKGAITQSGIYYGSSIVDSIINCTFVNNRNYPLVKNYTSAYDGVLYKNDMYLRNCIIWEPNAPLGQLLYNGDPDSLDVYDYELDHCLIKSETCTLPGGEEACETHLNYFDIDPMFKDPENGDYSLAACSPLLNLGLNYTSLGVLDLTNQPRIQQNIVDLGAYETLASTLGLTAAINNASTSTSNDGSIELSNIMGGTAPYTYQWSSGDTTAFIDMLLPDDYHLMITDAAGCSIDSTFTVSFTNAASTLNANQIKWYLSNNPAPVGTGSQVFFEGLKNEEHTLEVVNALGQSLHTIPFSVSQLRKMVRIQSFVAPKKGSYYLVLRNKQGQVLGAKIWVRI